MLEFWTQRKKRLDQCHQYILFERSAKQAVEWITQTGELYLATHTNVGKNRLENEQLLQEHNEFKGAAKVKTINCWRREFQAFSKSLSRFSPFAIYLSINEVEYENCRYSKDSG